MHGRRDLGQQDQFGRDLELEHHPIAQDGVNPPDLGDRRLGECSTMAQRAYGLKREHRHVEVPRHTNEIVQVSTPTVPADLFEGRQAFLHGSDEPEVQVGAEQLVAALDLEPRSLVVV